MISVHFQGKPFNITVIQGYAPTGNAEESEVERFNEDLQDLLELTPSPPLQRKLTHVEYIIVKKLSLEKEHKMASEMSIRFMDL